MAGLIPAILLNELFLAGASDLVGQTNNRFCQNISMKTSQHIIDFTEFESVSELNEADAKLLTTARAATADAYAPYSKFNVGAAALLTNGTIVTGTNQENASYPVGICAERTLLAAVSTQHKAQAISSMAVSYHNIEGDSNHPVAPCGMCRQSLVEFETRMDHPIRIIMSGMEGRVLIVENAISLLPLAFLKSELKKV